MINSTLGLLLSQQIQLAKITLLALSASIALAAPATYIVLPSCPSAPVVHVQADVRQYISSEAQCHGIPASEALFIAGHESQFGFRDAYNPAIRGKEPDGSTSRGIWQINNRSHSEVSDACADSLSCSTEWAMEQLKNGKDDMWSTWRFRAALYADERL